VGSIKPKAAFTAIAASTAVPPFFKISKPFGSQVADLKPPFHFTTTSDRVAKFLKSVLAKDDAQGSEKD
jgi:hypothetical protein